MKKILLLILIFVSLKSFCQYPVKQTLGSDSTNVESKGALKGRLINKPFSDTAAANAQRIKFYDGAQIYTNSGGGHLWIRDSALNKWVSTGGTGEINTASNLSGTGIGLYKTKSVADLQFKRLKAGINITIADMTDSVMISYSDTTWINADDYMSSNSDTTGLKTAFATGKNIRFQPHTYLINANLRPSRIGQIIEGQGQSTLLMTTKDTINIIDVINVDSVVIRNLSFKGTGKTTFPAGFFTYQNAIFYSTNANQILSCYFYDFKGSAIYSYNVSGCYSNWVFFNTVKRSTIGIYQLLSSEYGRYFQNQLDSNTVGGFERRSGNSKWTGNSMKYNITGFIVDGTNGDNGDHGGFYNGTLNHNTVALEIKSIYRGYEFIGNHLWYGDVNIGTGDTVRNVTFIGNEFANSTITTTKAKNTKMVNNTFSAVTVSGTTGIEYLETIGGGSENIKFIRDNITSTNDSTYKPVVFNPSTKEAKYFNSWAEIGLGGSAGWGLTGNTVGADGKWAGTIDNHDYTIKTNNTARVNILNTGEVGIGTSAAAGFKMFIVSGGNSDATDHSLWRNADGLNILRVQNGGTISMGNPSVSSNTVTIYGQPKLMNTNVGSTSDSVLVITSGDVVKAVAQSSIVGAVPPLQQVITSGSQLTASGSNTIDVNSGTLNINNSSVITLGSIGGNLETKLSVTGTPADYVRTLYSQNSTTPTALFEAIKSSTITSTINFLPDSIGINPNQGKVSIDSLRSGDATDDVMTWSTNGKVGHTSALHTTSFATAYAAKTTTYPITASDYTIEATSGTFTTTLPTAVGITGRQYVITNSGSGVVTLATTSSQTFVNVTATPTTLTLNQFNTVIVQSNGANWLRISSL